MATSHDQILCEICNEQGVRKHADKWCPECDEGLCFDCEKHHRISRASRHHIVISIDDYQKLPEEISKINHHCDVHGKKFQMYCPHHDQPCCLVCIANIHDNCTGLRDIDDVVKNAKTSSLLETIEQSLRDSQHNIESIIKNREQNLSKIKQQREDIQDKIKQKRDQINNHLDKLETKLVKELDNAEQTLTSQIGQLIEQLKEKSKAITQLQHNLTSIMSHASNLQTFLVTKHLEQQADEEEEYIISLANSESLQTTDLNLAINEKMADITAVITFGSVTVTKRPTSVSVQTAKDKQAQKISAVRMHPGSIDDINITLIRKFDLPKGKSRTCLTGCALFPNGQIALADCDWNKRIVITNDHGILQREIAVSPSRPFDVTCLNNNAVAFSCFNDKNIKIINTSPQTITNTITTTAQIRGITSIQGTLIYGERGKGIIRHQMDMESSNTVVRQDIVDWAYVTSNKNYIYYANTFTETVTCYQLNGDKLWEFKNTSVLKMPHGVAVDNQSNVYVASNKNNSIVVISSDGKTQKPLLTEKEGIKDPWGLAIDNERGNMLVTCYNGTVFLYKLSSRD